MPEGQGIKRLGVVGSGKMAVGIIQVATQHEVEVVQWSRNADSLARSMGGVEAGLQFLVSKGKINDEDKTRALARITQTREPHGFHSCDVIIEADAEDGDKKRDMLHFASCNVRPDTVIASATSTFLLEDILPDDVRHPERFGLFHPMNPFPVVKGIEIVGGPQTSQTTLDKLVALAKQLSHVPIRLDKAKHGFVVNRLLFLMINRAIQLVHEGKAETEVLDEAVKLIAGYPMGPLALADLVGFDVTRAIIEILHEDDGEVFAPPSDLLLEMIGQGLNGRTTKQGFYAYPLDKGAPAPEVPELTIELVKEEVLRPMCQEAQRLLDDGVADADTIALAMHQCAGHPDTGPLHLATKLDFHLVPSEPPAAAG